MSESKLTFYNRRGSKLAGVLNAPDAAAPAPAVVLCQGLSGQKHLVLPDIAASFSSRGIASLRFDYAGCGESEGERGWIDPPARVEDALYAFAWLTQQAGVDARRIGVYGHSYGGPVAICLAARERRVRAVVVVSGLGEGATMLRSLRTSWDWIAFRNRVEAERAKIATTGAASSVAVGEILPFSPAFIAAYEKLKAAAGGSSALASGAHADANMFRLASVDAILDLNPEDAARRLGGRPLLVVHGDSDDVAVIESAVPIYANAPGPKRWVTVPGAGHNDLDAGSGLAGTIALASDWFTEHLV